MELTEARRELEIARNVFEQAQKKFDRARTLKEQGILATQDWEQAEKDIQDARIRRIQGQRRQGARQAPHSGNRRPRREAGEQAMTPAATAPSPATPTLAADGGWATI